MKKNKITTVISLLVNIQKRGYINSLKSSNLFTFLLGCIENSAVLPNFSSFPNKNLDAAQLDHSFCKALVEYDLVWCKTRNKTNGWIIQRKFLINLQNTFPQKNLLKEVIVHDEWRTLIQKCSGARIPSAGHVEFCNQSRIHGRIWSPGAFIVGKPVVKEEAMCYSHTVCSCMFEYLIKSLNSFYKSSFKMVLKDNSLSVFTAHIN